MTSYKYSVLVLELCQGGLTKIEILRLLMHDYDLTHWQANREVFCFLRHK